ncbi:DNA-binding protein WhiA, partial [Eubacteriales bacterium OttesenSCG-928-N13]|nr:DNA-binding protein WhiA [Eubacteriales bacterium OttesenSCG-928-N13]
NEVNRQMNCDQNNLDKVIAASEKQISMIQTIERKMGLTELPPALMDIALLRLEHPDATMTELGQMATPELGKSGVNARMRKLEAIAEELVNG